VEFRAAARWSPLRGDASDDDGEPGSSVWDGGDCGAVVGRRAAATTHGGYGQEAEEREKKRH
jgi:hypothetical protein